MEKLREKIGQFFSYRINRISAVVFLLVFIMNCLVVPTSDDFGYMINDGFLDILKREYIQYMTWTGRSVAHLIARVFLALPKIVFNIFDSLCFVVLTRVMSAHACGGRDEERPLLYGLTVLLVFLFVPLFGQTVLWETGACNYLWTTAIVMLFLLPYRRGETKKNALLFLPAGIIAGWTNENTGGALILMILYFIGSDLVQKRKVQGWKWLGLAGALIGFAALILAPGNKVRAADFVSGNGMAYELIHDFTDFLSVLDRGQLILWLLFGVLAAYLVYSGKRRWMDPAAYAVSGLAAVAAIILTPVQVLFDRSMFGATILIITGIVCAFALLEEDSLIRKGMVLLCGIFVTLASLRYTRALADLAYTRYQYMGREAYVQAQKEAGNVNPVVPQLYREFETDYNPYHGLSDLSIYRRQWMNEYYSYMHGIESVQSTPLSKWNTIYRDGDPQLHNITDYDAYLAAVAENPAYTAVITSGRLSDAYAPFIEGLKKYGLQGTAENGYVIGLLSGGTITEGSYSASPGEMDTMLGGHYCYWASNPDPVSADVLVDGIEYTNDHAGITVVVFSSDKDRVVDSITFIPDSDQGGIRYYIEK